MSALKMTQQALVIPSNNLPKRPGAAPNRAPIPQRIQISEIYERSSTENPASKIKPLSRLNPIDNGLSIDLLQQYNDIVGSKESLAYKRLPPVKVSYQTTKNKFIESPRKEGVSRIIRPHLSLKTYSPGHHIFTEGISKSSVTRSPTFAVQQIGAPYSNLPDNISIYKEKNQFAFGVKFEESEKSPYRLTPRPFKLGSATLIPALEANAKKSNAETNSYAKTSRRYSKYNPGRTLEIKSNFIKLQPLVPSEKESKSSLTDNSEFSTDIVKIPAGFTRPTKSPLAPSNSFYLTETKAEVKQNPQDVEEKHLGKGIAKNDTPIRKLSIVSIGKNVGSNFIDSKKREIRQLYPMYDNTSKKTENLKRQKFEYSEGFILKAKPKVPSSTFTYKVSTQGMTFVQDTSVDKFKPIKNNLYDRHGHVIHKQRGLGRYRPSDSEDDTSKSCSDYNFRRYYKRVFRRPKSSESQGTDFSQLPGNPPPSEISHILSEDAPVLINDVRNGMVTLIEERTMTTTSITSPRKDTSLGEGRDNTRYRRQTYETPDSKLTTLEDTETCTDTDIQFENAIRSMEQEPEIQTLTTEICKCSVSGSGLYMTQKLNHDISANETSSKGDGSLVEEYIAEAEERIKHIVNAEENETKPVHFDMLTETNKSRLDTIGEDLTNNRKAELKIKVACGKKQCLAVPTLCLDSVDPYPLSQVVKERTSLSRSMQKMTIPEQRKKVTIPDLSHEMSKSILPVTSLRLFSESSSFSGQTQSVNLTDENGDFYEVLNNARNDSNVTDEVYKEKKLLNNANLTFIYPLTNEVKAKRQ